MAGADETPLFTKPEEQKVAQIAYEVIRNVENQPRSVPTVGAICRSRRSRRRIVKAVEEQHRPAQLALEGVAEQPDIAAVVAKTVELVTEQTIDIPRILVVPKGEVKSGFRPFTLDLAYAQLPAVSDELWIQHLRTGQLRGVCAGRGGIEEQRLEDYVVSGLVDFDDVAYDDHADLLYDLAGQVVSTSAATCGRGHAKGPALHQRDIARFIHAQMQEHYWEEAEPATRSRSARASRS